MLETLNSCDCPDSMIDLGEMLNQSSVLANKLTV